MKKKIYISTALLSATFFFSACSPKPYSYPNYDIIKPKKVCEPNRKNIQLLLSSCLGKPYVWAEEGPDAFDCSGLTYNIYGSMGMEIPRVAREQAKVGKTIPFSKLEYGDLIFFGNTNRHSKRINHVGIYLGDGWFAHASSQARKVTVTHFSDAPKYLQRIKLCKRYLGKNKHIKYLHCDVPLHAIKTTTTRYSTPWKTGMPLPSKAVPG